MRCEPARRLRARGARRRSRALGLALRAAPGRHRPDRGGDRRRRRRVLGPAAQGVRLPAARRPAPGAGRAVRGRRVGRDLGAGPAAPVRQRRASSTGTRSATCSSSRCGSCSATTSTGLDWVGPAARRRGARAPDGAGPARHHRAGARASTPARPDGRTTVRGQVEVATTAGHVLSVALDPADPLACPRGSRGRRARPTGWCSGPAPGSPA